jgi:hypothetical protein
MAPRRGETRSRRRLLIASSGACPDTERTEDSYVESAIHPTVRAWDGSYHVPRITAEQAGKVGRVAAFCVLGIAAAYCGSVAWDVIQSLRDVKLHEIGSVLYRVSVGDALLTWFAYVFGRELLHAGLGGRRDRLY